MEDTVLIDDWEKNPMGEPEKIDGINVYLLGENMCN